MYQFIIITKIIKILAIDDGITAIPAKTSVSTSAYSVYIIEQSAPYSKTG